MFAKFHHMIAGRSGHLVFNQGMVVLSHKVRLRGASLAASWVVQPFRQSTCLIVFERFVVLGLKDSHLDRASAMGS